MIAPLISVPQGVPVGRRKKNKPPPVETEATSGVASGTTPAPDASPTGTARIDAELLEQARFVCLTSRDSRGRPVKLGDYLYSILRPVIQADYQKAVERVASSAKKKPEEP